MRESELFEYIKTKYLSDLKQSEDKFSRWDCYSQKRNTRIELKCRQKHYNELMIEKDKFIYLLMRNKLYGEKCFYINSTPVGIYSFNIVDINPTWITDKRMPTTTEFENNERKEKTYSLININISKKI
jgi:hypothetical protein